MKTETNPDMAQMIIIRHKSTLQSHLLVLKGEYEIHTLSSKSRFSQGVYFEKVEESDELNKQIDEFIALRNSNPVVQEKS